MRRRGRIEKGFFMPTVVAAVAFLDHIAPPALAAEWDNVGLLLGEGTAEVRRVMTCLTVTPVSAAEAVAESADLIVTHHPILFRSVKRLTDGTAEGRMLLALARANVAVYSPHTAFDDADGGINDLLARRLGLINVGPLRPRDVARACKMVAYTPEKDLERVSEAMFAAGAGQIGHYSECSYRLLGTGTFFGSDAANPTVGHKGRREQVAEWRLEAICPEADVNAVLAAVRRAHSYEEPAIDVYPLRPSASPRGVGRIGLLPDATSLCSFAEAVKKSLKAGPVQMVGDAEREVRRVAIACGAGGELLSDAVRAGADVLLTGEARFHDYLAAQAQGLALVLPGHYGTERCGVEDLADRLKTEWPDALVWASRRERDPAEWV
jgi:dinuclear metal center YbgI/SA1388 family protein